jgi:hypothetical protein
MALPVAIVHPRQIERNWSSKYVEWRIALDVEMDGRRFNISVANPFLFVCQIKNN